MSNNQDIHKKHFYSKLKTAKKINSRLITPEDFESIRRFLSNSEKESGSCKRKFQKILKKELTETFLKLLTWEQTAMLYVHLQHHLQSLVRKIQGGGSMFPSYNQLQSI